MEGVIGNLDHWRKLGVISLIDSFFVLLTEQFFMAFKADVFENNCKTIKF